MAERRSAEGPSATTTANSGRGAAAPGGRREANARGTVGVYDRPAFWQTKKGAIMITAVIASSLLTLFFYLAAN